MGLGNWLNERTGHRRALHVALEEPVLGVVGSMHWYPSRSAAERARGGKRPDQRNQSKAESVSGRLTMPTRVEAVTRPAT